MCVHLQPASLETTVFWILFKPRALLYYRFQDFIVRRTYPLARARKYGRKWFCINWHGKDMPSVVRLDLSLNIINYIRMHWNSLEIGWKNSGQLLEFLDRCISVFCYIWLQLIDVFWQVQSQEFSQWSPTHLERKSI